MQTAIALFFAGVVLTLAVVFAVLGLLPNHADLAFLCVAGFSAVSYVIWLFSSRWFDNTNGNDMGIIINMVLWVTMGLAVIGAPAAVFLGIPWLTAVYAACGILLLMELFAAWQMSR